MISTPAPGAPVLLVHGGRRFAVDASVSGPAQLLVAGSKPSSSPSYYYTRQRDGGTLEYEVTHPRWTVWTADTARFEGDADRLYGPDVARILAGLAQSASWPWAQPFLVFKGRRLDLGGAGTR